MTSTTTIQVEWNVDENDSNAVIWYQVENEGQGQETGKIITKTNYVYLRTTPSLSTLYYTNQSLIDCCKECTSSSNVVRAIVYNNDGYIKRIKIKHQIEKDITNSTCKWIVLTCGLVLCCSCCFPKWCNQSNITLSEENYCKELNKLYPNDIISSDSINYQFINMSDAIKVK